MRAHIASRLRSSSLSAVPPSRNSPAYSVDLAKIAASILYRSPLPSKEGRPVFVLNAAALPDSQEADYDDLLPYVLSRLPEEDELLKGFEYEVVFFAGDGDTTATSRKHRPGWGWFLQAYHVLSRAMRKRLQKLYIVHEKAWVRILTEIFSTIVSPKFRRKIYHLSTMTTLALHIPVENLLIPPSTYLSDRRVSEDIYAPYVTGKRAFAVCNPLPKNANGGTRFPRVLRETTNFVLMKENIVSEGIFRIPPNSKLRDVLKEAYDRAQKYVIWKDNEVMLPVPPHRKAEHQDEILAEVDPKDAYSVFMAASLIKVWYASLKQPIFPQTSYVDLKRFYGDSQDIPDLNRLKDLFSPTSEWSFLPGVSREIVVRHLLPLLSAVADRQEENKMTAENLAVCFAPALLCGPDQLEDAKMSSIIRRIFTQAVDLWSEGLREACGQEPDNFQNDLQLPKDEQEWDDPLEGRSTIFDTPLDDQMSGITLQDNDLPSPTGPPLPPRTTTAFTTASTDLSKRKPAHPLPVPPRHSTIVSDNPQNVSGSPVVAAATTDGFASRRDALNAQGPPMPARPKPVIEDTKFGTRKSIPPSTPVQTMTKSDPFSHPSTSRPQLNTKRKVLTPAQVNNVVHAQDEQRKTSDPSQSFDHVQRGVELPGLAVRKRGASVVTSPRSNTLHRAVSPTVTVTAPTRYDSPTSYSPPSRNRLPSITGLARPLQPGSSSASLPCYNPSSPATLQQSAFTPRLRIPSPGLIQRMPSFENPSQPTSPPDPVSRKLIPPQKLNLKKHSVDNLRRLYEERAGTVSAVIEAGRYRQN